MKKIYFLTFISMLLSGCTGTSSEFQCNATTSDRCMTMEQANDIARSKTEGARGKLVAGELPALVELPAPSSRPFSFPSESNTLSSPANNTFIPKSLDNNKQAAFKPANSNSQLIYTQKYCDSSRCDRRGESIPIRLTDAFATIWIAPWIDDSDAFHQPGRISFVLTPGTWQLPQQLN